MMTCTGKKDHHDGGLLQIMSPIREMTQKLFPFHKNEIKIINNLQSEMEWCKRKDGCGESRLHGNIPACTAQSLFRRLQNEREISIRPSERRAFYLRWHSVVHKFQFWYFYWFISQMRYNYETSMDCLRGFFCLVQHLRCTSLRRRRCLRLFKWISLR